MTVIPRLARSMGARSEEPNQLLAAEIAEEGNTEAVAELMTLLGGSDKKLQNDAVKTLYETGRRRPELLTPYFETFLGFLGNPNNRLAWGAMCSLEAMAATIPHTLAPHLEKIRRAAGSGSVICRDHAVRIFVGLGRHAQYRELCTALLLEQLMAAPVNQLASYAEQSLALAGVDNKGQIERVLRARLEEIAQESKRRRIEKVLHRLAKLPDRDIQPDE